MSHVETDSPEFSELKRVSERIGRNPSQIQAGGGNTSWKTVDRMFVKASGKRLMDAIGDEIFVEVSVLELKARVASPRHDDDERFVPTARDSAGNPSRLRPSIEAAFHAILDAPVILYTHSTSVIAHSILRYGKDILAKLLTGLPWAWIHYVKPGVPLAREVAEAARGGAVRIFILANHGLIVTGTSVAEAEALLETVEQRLHRPSETALSLSGAAASRLDAVIAAWDETYQVASNPVWHELGLRPRAFDLVRGGSLYPDHVIFLGPAVWFIPKESPAASQPVNLSPIAATGTADVIIVESAGCLVRRSLAPAPLALLGCLAEVAAKKPAGEPVNYLTTRDEADLLNWDAEHYRQKLAADR